MGMDTDFVGHFTVKDKYKKAFRQAVKQSNKAPEYLSVWESLALITNEEILSAFLDDERHTFIENKPITYKIYGNTCVTLPSVEGEYVSVTEYRGLQKDYSYQVACSFKNYNSTIEFFVYKVLPKFAKSWCLFSLHEDWPSTPQLYLGGWCRDFVKSSKQDYLFKDTKEYGIYKAYKELRSKLKEEDSNSLYGMYL